ncbi:MAG: hypothetical protein CBD97_03155 [Pelagibacteraceae bacterium TMED237]|nr:MAG: hypothetical protein CBD97_03155 [Pelagibacteraceae bacterium TMED237]|tara:strand:- start:1558 stop:2070 length:513 start_codon:yes stop_codon:yes gene_type:complete
MKKKIIIIISCFALFVILVFSQGLKSNKIYDTKDLIGKSITEIDLELLNENKKFNTKDLSKNNFTLINFWASWCAPCRKEHKHLLELSKNIKILGINFKDEKSKANKFIKNLGNPYYLIASDSEGKKGVEFGVYGIPETILIDNNLIIKAKYIGPINGQDVKKILKLIDR